MQRILFALALTAAAPALAQSIEQAMSDFASQFEQAAPVQEKVHFSPSATIVEFFNQNLKHYFRTADPAEVAGIMNGSAGPGWIRTNDDFPAWTAAFLPSTALAVCRFYAAGPNSHFFTISASECAQVKLDPGWHYEGTAFYALAPGLTGCTSEFIPVYRSYNNRFAFNDSNHRFTTSQATYQQQNAQGWAGEGIVMCVPTITTFDQQKTEQLLGGQWTIRYTFGAPYADTAAYTGLTQSTTAPFPVYAAGLNQRGYATLGAYSSDISRWLILSSFRSSGGYPYDAYLLTAINGNTMTGCYFFLTSSSSTLNTTCSNPLTGTR